MTASWSSLAQLLPGRLQLAHLPAQLVPQLLQLCDLAVQLVPQLQGGGQVRICHISRHLARAPVLI